MPILKITRRMVDPITFDERVAFEFVPRIEDFALDSQLAGSMSYEPPRRLPPPPAPPSNFRPPTPPKQRGIYNPNAPRSPSNSPIGKRKNSIKLKEMLSPRGRQRTKSALGSIGELDEQASEGSLTDLSSVLQTSVAPFELHQGTKPAAVEKCVRFADENELNEISRLRNSVIAELFWASEDLANFRYEAFMEEAGLDMEEFD